MVPGGSGAIKIALQDLLVVLCLLGVLLVIKMVLDVWLVLLRLVRRGSGGYLCPVKCSFSMSCRCF